MSKATPKAGITLVSKNKDTGSLQWLHGPSASGDFNLKHKLGSNLTLGVGFSVRVSRREGVINMCMRGSSSCSSSSMAKAQQGGSCMRV